MECLHTILLGPYKYLTAALMDRLSPQEKDLVMARIRAFIFSGFTVHLTGNICRYVSFCCNGLLIYIICTMHSKVKLEVSSRDIPRAPGPCRL